MCWFLEPKLLSPSCFKGTTYFQSNVTSLRRLIYGSSDLSRQGGLDEDDDESSSDEIGGMFKVIGEKQSQKSSSLAVMDQASI